MSEERFAAAIRAFDAANAQDPTTLPVGGRDRPKALLDAERLSVWVERLDPNASEPLQLAARCQHIRRWMSPRSDYPAGRKGYIQWRTSLHKFHAKTAVEILTNLGFEPDTLQKVERIVMKKGLGREHDTQVMEDALCLAFLEHELDAFAAKHPDEKIIDIVQKTWRKMSDNGHAAALKLSFSERSGSLVKAALQPAT